MVPEFCGYILLVIQLIIRVQGCSIWIISSRTEHYNELG